MWVVDLCDIRDNFLEIDKVNIRYKVAEPDESKFDVVLLHGMSFNADTWVETGTIKFLCNSGYRVFAVDMPGFGKSGGRRLKRSFAAEFLRKILEKLKVEKPILVGPSMGGGIALSYAINFNNLRGLVLIAPAGLNDPEIVENLDKISDIPTLVVWGDKDRVFPLSMSKILTEKLERSSLVVCKNAPHPCYLRATEQFHAELKSFLDSL